MKIQMPDGSVRTFESLEQAQEWKRNYDLNKELTPGFQPELVKVKMPDGSVQEFSDRISAKRAIDAYRNSPEQRIAERLGVKERQSDPSMGESALRSFEQGMTLGLSDEVAGLAGAVRGTAKELSGMQTDKDDSYIGARDRERQLQSKDRETNPYSTLASQMLGSMGAAAQTSPSTGLTNNIRQGMMIGGVEGAGLSTSDTPVGLVLDTLKGTTIGGAIGAAATGLEKLGGKIIKKMTKAENRPVLPAELAKEQEVTLPQNEFQSGSLAEIPAYANQPDNPAAFKQREQDFNDLGITPTQADLSQNRELKLKQQELAATEGPVAERVRNQATGLRESANKQIRETGGDPFSTGQVYNKVREKATQLDEKVSDLYKQATEAAPDAKNVRFEKTGKVFNNLRDSGEMADSRPMKELRRLMRSQGLLSLNNAPSGRISPQQAELLRQKANDLYTTANGRDRQLLREFKDAVDEDVFKGAGDDFYQTARQQKMEYEKQLDPAKRDKFDKRKVSLLRDIRDNKLTDEKFKEAVLTGSKYNAEDLKDLKDYVEPEQWKNMGAAALNDIIDKSIKGDKISLDRFKKAISDVGDEKLNVLLEPSEREYLKKVGRVISYVQRVTGKLDEQPPLSKLGQERAKRAVEYKTKVAGVGVVIDAIQGRVAPFLKKREERKLLELVDEVKEAERKITPMNTGSADTAASTGLIDQTQFYDPVEKSQPAQPAQEDFSKLRPVDRPIPKEADTDAVINKTLDYLKDREGIKYETYLDTENKPTAGIGHLLTPEEQKKYPVGTKIPKEVVDKWFEEDTKKSFRAANKQMKELGITDPNFKKALTSVNFQLGTAWNDTFKNAYKHLKNKDYDRAIQEIKFTKEGSGVPSKWSQQTPKRVDDFVKAIERLKEK